MGLFDRLFRRRPEPPPPPAPGLRRYEYPTGNLEVAIRLQRGEPLTAVIEEVRVRWVPGNEHLWDGIDPESLVDADDRRKYTVNHLLYARLTVYRALRAAGRDPGGRDPFEFAAEVPEVVARLRARFPESLGRPGPAN